jgi:hypothetical protein
MLGVIEGEVPLSSAAAREAGVIGALMLDSNEAVADFSLLKCLCDWPCVDQNDSVCCAWEKDDRATCCFSRVYVPFPCNCFGADCACCPHSPRGGAWETALASGFGPLLAEAAPLARSVKLGSTDYRGLVELARARAVLLNTNWVPRANALLSGCGLRVSAFSYAFAHPLSTGGRRNWGTRCVLQFYDSAAAAQGRSAADVTGAAKAT